MENNQLIEIFRQLKIEDSKHKSVLNRHRRNAINKSHVDRIMSNENLDFTCAPQSTEQLDDVVANLQHNIEQMSNEIHLYERVKKGETQTIDLTSIVHSRTLEKNSNTLIAEAANGNTERVKELIPISDPKTEQSRALRFAAQYGYTEIVQLLIPVSDPKAIDSEALRLAAKFGHTDTVRLLIPVSEPMAEASDALQLAALHGQVECIKLLIPVSNPKADNSASLQWALQQRRVDSDHLECVKCLIPVSNCDEVLNRLQDEHKHVLKTCMEEYEVMQQKERLLNRLHRVVNTKNISNKRKI